MDATAGDAEVRLYDDLFTDAEPGRWGQELPGLLNPSPGGAPRAKVRPAWPARRPRLPVLRQGYCVWTRTAPAIQVQLLGEPQGLLQFANEATGRPTIR